MKFEAKIGRPISIIERRIPKHAPDDWVKYNPEDGEIYIGKIASVTVTRGYIEYCVNFAPNHNWTVKEELLQGVEVI